MIVITIILAILLILTVCYGIYQKRKTYRMIDRLLDSVLNREKIACSDVEEGEYSALVSKIRQIQEVLENHVKSSDSEKEQVKSLVSNMSHQLKTPLANLSLYSEILGQGEIAPERKSEFVERFPELSLFYRLFSPLDSEMICIFPYFCPYAESAREIREIFVALHINNWFSEPILI